MMVSNRTLLFQWSIFRGYVSFREGKSCGYQTNNFLVTCWPYSWLIYIYCMVPVISCIYCIYELRSSATFSPPFRYPEKNDCMKYSSSNGDLLSNMAIWRIYIKFQGGNTLHQLPGKHSLQFFVGNRIAGFRGLKLMEINSNLCSGICKKAHWKDTSRDQ